MSWNLIFDFSLKVPHLLVLDHIYFNYNCGKKWKFTDHSLSSHSRDRLVHRWKSAILDSFTLAHVLKKWPQMVRWILYSLLLFFLSYKACGVVTLLMSIHWSVCWLKKTENKQFDDVLLPISLDFVIVYIKMIIDFKNFLFPFSWRNMVKGTKLITMVWRSIFSTFFGMNAVQNETLKN